MPPLIVRRASTTVELRDGQSFVIGGLLQSNGKNAISQLPWLGDVPVLGALFRSASVPEERNRSRHHRHAAAGAPGAARRRHQDAARRLAAGQRRRSVPDGQDRSHAGRGARLMAGVPPREFTGHMLDLPKGGTNVVSVRN